MVRPTPTAGSRSGIAWMRAHRRRGLASEAVAAMFDWARREHGVHRFRASVAPDNAASQAVIARFGFRQTGVQWDDLDGEELVFDLDDPEVARGSG